MKILCTQGTSRIAKLIMKLTASDVSHVALLIDDDVYFSSHNTGVVKVPHTVWLRTNHVKYNYEIKDLDEVVVRLRAESKVGLPYGWFNLVLFTFNSPFYVKHWWMCSRYIAYCLQELIPHKNYHLMSPRLLKLVGHAHTYTPVIS